MNMELLRPLLLPLFLFALAKAAEEDFKIEVTQKPSGDCERKAENGDFLTVHYTGSFANNGEKFDSSRDRGQPFSFVLGRREVILGYEKGLHGMCVGEKRKLIVPPEMGK